MKITNWITAVGFCILWCIVLLIYLHIRGKEKKIEILKERQGLITRNKLIFLIVGTIIGLFLFWMTDEKGGGTISCYKNMITFLWMLPIAFIDYKEKIIPNKLILSGIIYWIMYAATECIYREVPITNMAKYSLGGFAFGAGVLLVSALIIRGGVGMGDVKLFSVIGLIYGFNGVFTILFMTLLILFVVSIVLLIGKKVDKKSSFPMAPFVAIGFIISVVMGI